MNLVIVESPTKARTLGRFLGKDYQIEASMGHVMDLPKSKLGVDVEHDFKPDYVLVKGKGDIVRDLKTKAKSADAIILATDPDREGEAIASHVKDVLSLNSKFAFRQETRSRRAIRNSKFSRIVFHEITKEAIEEALAHPREIDMDLVSAQTARRVLDRLVGYKLSPLLWMKVRRGLSAGRVQSVALRLIVEREREIEKFKKEEYWTIKVLLEKERFSRQSHVAEDARQPSARNLASSSSSLSERRSPKTNSNLDNVFGSAFSSSASGLPPRAAENATEFELIEIDGEKIELSQTFNLYDGEYRVTKTVIEKESKAKEIESDLKTKQFVVSDIVQKEMRRSPQPPFTTSTLQQEAARRLGFSGKRTMSLAQKLYEEGFITYHRTDSVAVSKMFLGEVRNFIKKEFGEKFLPGKPRFYQTKQKLAQEAHEAIRPTYVGKLQAQSAKVKSQIGNDYSKLYELIWRRAVASQMTEAVIESTTVLVDAQVENGKLKVENGEKYRFKANGSVLIFEGFLKVNPQALEDKKLPKFKALEPLELLDIKTELKETQPAPRYNYASLVATLEEKGIGRPSTYAPIIETIEIRHYVEKDPSAGWGRFVSTPVGVAVNDFLVANFAEIDDIPFTAKMEDELDEIAQGEKQWVPVIREFYIPFEKKIEEAKKGERVKIKVEETSEVCDKCGQPMVIRLGKYGKFLSCSTFPKCDFKKPIIEETTLVCPKDGGKIIIKKTRRGRRFYGCSNYPKCDFAAWKKEQIPTS